MTKKTKGKKSSATKKKNTTKQQNIGLFTAIKRMVHSEQFPGVVAVFLAIFVIFCFLSFVSFFVTWFSDYKLVENVTSWSLLKGERDINSWGGSLGAFLAYVLIRNTFGIASFGFLIILSLFVIRLFGTKVNSQNKWIVSTMLIMLWLSCILGFVVVGFGVERLEYLSGIVGVGICQGLCFILGKIGCALFLVAFTIVIPMILFKVRYTRVINSAKSLFQRTNSPKQERKQKPEKSQQSEDPENKSSVDTELGSGMTINDKFAQQLHSPAEPVSRENDSQEDENPTVVDNDGITFTIKDADGNIISQESVTYDSPSEPSVDPEEEMQHNTIDEPYDPHADLPNFQMPPEDLLIDYDKNNTQVTNEELIANNEKIKKTLANFGIAIKSIEATPGPTVTLYEIVPADGVRIAKIRSISEDIALSLASTGIRIIAPIPGRGTVGIEVPNVKAQTVSMLSMIKSPQFQNSKAELPIVLGKTVENRPYVFDLAKAPHLLVAGATGQGKSVGLNAIVASLLYKKHPSDIKLIFVDPKKVEFSLYSGIERHYLAKIPGDNNAVITEVDEVLNTLNSLCALMDDRYRLLQDVQCRNITEYNAKFLSRRIPPVNGHDYMPYIVVIIDEFADLIMTAGKKIEYPICRIAQLARAVGIHLIIATQRPSVKVITGMIKTNFPARLAFKTSSGVDSKTILDSVGAEKLIGRGDALVSLGNDTTRLQCAYIDTQDVMNLTDFISTQNGFPECFLLPDPPMEEGEGYDNDESLSSSKLDSLFEEAAALIIETQYGSTSTLQRKYSIGYNRAGKIMDQLERAGIVGPYNGSKPRQVLIRSKMELDEIMARILQQ